MQHMHHSVVINGLVAADDARGFHGAMCHRSGDRKMLICGRCGEPGRRLRVQDAAETRDDLRTSFVQSVRA